MGRAGPARPGRAGEPVEPILHYFPPGRRPGVQGGPGGPVAPPPRWCNIRPTMVGRIMGLGPHELNLACPKQPGVLSGAPEDGTEAFFGHFPSRRSQLLAETINPPAGYLP